MSLSHYPSTVTSIHFFWVTVCKTVRPVLKDRCLSVLSVTLVYCGQMVGWIKMKLGMQVGLGSGHILLHKDSAPLPKRGRSPQFSAHVCCSQIWGGGSAPFGGRAPSPNFWPISVVAKQLDGSICCLLWRYRPRSRRHCVRFLDPVKLHLLAPSLLRRAGLIRESVASAFR